jgi:hypothetical protein
MKNFKSNIVAVLVVVCFSFVAFAAQPVEAVSHTAKAGISAPAKHKKPVKKAKKAKKSNKAKKEKSLKSAKKSSSKTKQPLLPEDPSAQ